MKKNILFILFLCFFNTIKGQVVDSCSNIDVKTDKFNKTTTYKYRSDTISISKVYYPNGDYYYLVFIAIEYPTTITSRGVTLLLANDELVRDSKASISCNYLNNGKYLITSYVELSSLDIPSMLKHEITDVRVGTIDISIKNGKDLIAALKCLVNK